MDMDRDSLELMLNLLDTDCNIKTALEGHRELAKNKQKVNFVAFLTILLNLMLKVIDICTEMKAAGHAGSLNIDLLSADHLAMETLLRFVSFLHTGWFFLHWYPHKSFKSKKVNLGSSSSRHLTYVFYVLTFSAGNQ